MTNVREVEAIACSEMDKYSQKDIAAIIDMLFDFAVINRGLALSTSFAQCLDRGLTEPAPPQRLKVGLLLAPQKNDKLQYQWFRRAAEEGNLDALFRSASAGLRANSISLEEWRQLILSAADQGHMTAQREAADRYLGRYRQGTPTDIWPTDGYQALYWYTRLASNQHATHSCGAHLLVFQDVCEDRLALSALKVIIGAIYNRSDLSMPRDVRAAKAWWKSAYDDGGEQRAIAGTLLFRLHREGIPLDVSPERLKEYEQFHSQSLKAIIQH